MKTRSTLFFFCLIFLVATFNFSLKAQGLLMWAGAFGGVNNDRGHAIATDGSGNVYTAGYFSGTVDFDPGPGVYTITSIGYQDAYIVKHDVLGNFSWVKAVGGGSATAAIYGFKFDAAGNYYMTGSYSGTVDFDPGAGTFTIASTLGGDIFITKFDALGNFAWAKSFGGLSASNNEYGYGVAADASGVFAVGTYSGTCDFDPGPGTYTLTANNTDAFITKLDPFGNFVWVGGFGASNYDAALAVSLDASGNVYATGHYRGTVDFDPGPGVANISASSIYDNMFVCKHTSTGGYVWAKQIGGNFWCYGSGIAVDGGGNVYTTGDFYANVDFDPGAMAYSLTSFPGGAENAFVHKMTTGGVFTWVKQYSSSQSAVGSAITMDALGNAFFTGWFGGTCDFDPGAGVTNLTAPGGTGDIFVSGLTSAGNFIWAKNVGSSLNDYGTAITTDVSSNVCFTGYFQSTADLDPSAIVYTVTSKGGDDTFVIKLSGGTGVGVAEKKSGNGILVYPNPSANTLYVKLPDGQNEFSYEILNVIGQVIKTSSVKTRYSVEGIDIHELPQGAYIINIKLNEELNVIRFVKE